MKKTVSDLNPGDEFWHLDCVCQVLDRGNFTVSGLPGSWVTPEHVPVVMRDGFKLGVINPTYDVTVLRLDTEWYPESCVPHQSYYADMGVASDHYDTVRIYWRPGESIQLVPLREGKEVEGGVIPLSLRREIVRLAKGNPPPQKTFFVSVPGCPFETVRATQDQKGQWTLTPWKTGGTPALGSAVEGEIVPGVESLVLRTVRLMSAR
jgi:hypothetical protein